MLKYSYKENFDEKIIIFGNLPYNISTQILIKWIKIKNEGFYEWVGFWNGAYFEKNLTYTWKCLINEKKAWRWISILKEKIAKNNYRFFSFESNIALEIAKYEENWKSIFSKMKVFMKV